MASLGEAAYQAYVEHCGGRSIHGEPLPSWDLQVPAIRGHREAAAEGVLAELTQYER